MTDNEKIARFAGWTDHPIFHGSQPQHSRRCKVSELNTMIELNNELSSTNNTLRQKLENLTVELGEYKIIVNAYKQKKNERTDNWMRKNFDLKKQCIEQQSQLRLLAEAVLMVDGQRDWETLLLTEDEREAFESACVLAKEIMGW